MKHKCRKDEVDERVLSEWVQCKVNECVMEFNGIRRLEHMHCATSTRGQRQCQRKQQLHWGSFLSRPNCPPSFSFSKEFPLKSTLQCDGRVSLAGNFYPYVTKNNLCN